MFLGVVNASTVFSDEDARKALHACERQLRFHVAPLWGAVPAPVVFYPKPEFVPEGADILMIMDDAEHAGALGYHKETPQGEPYGRVFAKAVLDHGGSALEGASSVAVTISHEVCEWFIDPNLVLWADSGHGLYPLEICDPVEGDSYDLDGVSVCNFVTRAFFDPHAPAGSQFDYMGKVRTPFTCTDAGYMQVRRGGSMDVILGASYPDWKSATKAFPAARSNRREAAASRPAKGRRKNTHVAS